MRTGINSRVQRSSVILVSNKRSAAHNCKPVRAVPSLALPSPTEISSLVIMDVLESVLQSNAEFFACDLLRLRVDIVSSDVGRGPNKVLKIRTSTD
ncbi:hypothetical protein Zmor_006441 [Zophobas morio]|uniref:Uncharacterized protein n=1 Tax=Zophobas morio TaxID=2755281 RepID=A0AA38MNI1_9CUCU|nr:hypothetical protein Zmor_006441 [Zophobas morio]